MAAAFFAAFSTKADDLSPGLLSGFGGAGKLFRFFFNFFSNMLICIYCVLIAPLVAVLGIFC
jgi:hypothetical protein